MSVSYSLDGVRWTSIGTVGRDNWKGYRVAVPVSSWTDVNRLQIMLNVLPTLDTKPDIYLESMEARADYSRTVREALSDAVASASDAADAVVAKIIAAVEDKPAPQKPAPVEIIHKKLLIAQDGKRLPGPKASDVAPSTDKEGSSLVISGSCSKKYFVVLLYKNEEDYGRKPSSYVANEARECSGGRFSYALSSLSTDIRPGRYFLLTAEEDDTGPWQAASSLFPVTIQASTTVEVIQP
jgi:hypothetical protein